MKHNSGFTLIELLTTIGIIAILSIMVIWVLNPAVTLQQSRDVRRLSDLKAINGNLDFFHSQGGISLGSSSVIYVSIPDPTATTTAGDQCQGLGLLTLPSGYTYHCPYTNNYRNTDGTGWIPVNFNSIPSGNLLGTLPVDPVNTSSSRDYYTYATANGQWQLTETMESSLYKLGGGSDQVSTDGGHLASLHELGTDLNLQPLDYGDTSLVTYLGLDEGTGTMAYDDSGNANIGTWSGSGGGSYLYYAPGEVGLYGGYFNGSDDEIDFGALTFSKSLPFSVSLWFDLSALNNNAGLFTQYLGGWNGFNILINSSTLNAWYMSSAANYTAISKESGIGTTPGYPLATGTWYHAVIIVNTSGMQMYVNGKLYTSAPWAGTAGVETGNIDVYIGNNNDHFFSGMIDDVRMYNRALSSAEVAALAAMP